MMDEVKKEFWKWFWIVVLATVLLSIVGFVMNSAGLLGSTVVEREVFENSYQKTAAVESQIAIDTATLREIEMKLSNPNLDESTRYNLEAQASAARIRIESAKGN